MARDQAPETATARMSGDHRITPPAMRFANPRRELLGVTQALVALMRGGQTPPTIMVSGIEGGEGATTITSNLARAVAQEFAGQVCLVRLESDDAAPAEAPATDGENVISATLSRSDLAATLDQGLLRGLQRLPVEPLVYLIDGPPLLDSLEAYRLCSEVDGLVLVAQAERTTPAALDAARAIVAGCRCRLLGAVLNKRRRRLPAFIADLLGGTFHPRAAPVSARVVGAPDKRP